MHTIKKSPDYSLLYSIAENQAGYFTASQASEAGYSFERLSDLTSGGKFIRIQRGIYRLSFFPVSRFEDLFIALLRTGNHSVISHDSALAVYELSDILPSEIHVIIPRTGSRRRVGLNLHTNHLEDDEITYREGLRITTVERTITDVIAAGIGLQHAQQAIYQALQQGLTTEIKLKEQAVRCNGYPKRIIEQVLQEMKG